MHIVEGEHPNADIAEYFYRLGLNSQYKNDNYISKIVEKLNGEIINKDSKYVCAREGNSKI